MRPLFHLLLFLGCFQSHAGYQHCPTDWVMKNMSAYEALKKLEGLSKTGSCILEVHLCTDSKETSSDKLLGDVLITLNGKSFYIPLYVDQLSDSSSSYLKKDRWGIKYKFRDSNQDPLSGENERDELEFLFDRKTNELDSVEMRKKNDRDFTWFLFFKLAKGVVCGRAEK